MSDTTKKELSNLFFLNLEIEKEKQRLSELEAAATDTSAKISGLPHVSGLSDKTAIAAEIADTRSIIDAKIKASVVEYNRLIRYISSIDDSLIREIMRLRHVDGKSWAAVALQIGGGNTADGVRKLHDRFLKEKD